VRRYIALLHPDATGGYGVSFPEFPGCISGGDTLAEAADQAAQALRLHVEGMIEDGETIPEPRSAEELGKDSRVKAWFKDATVALVPLLPPRDRVERLNISLDRNLVREIDTAAKALGMNRSAFLAAGAQRLLEDAAVSQAPRSGFQPKPRKGASERLPSKKKTHAV
jgi:predicted RNase H-like HicB family nuclease